MPIGKQADQQAVDHLVLTYHYFFYFLNDFSNFFLMHETRL